jgi:hypothetical protein
MSLRTAEEPVKEPVSSKLGGQPVWLQEPA